MTKYNVKMRVTKTLKDPLHVFGDSEAEAKIHAEKIVSKWEGVEDAEAYEIEEAE